MRAPSSVLALLLLLVLALGPSVAPAQPFITSADLDLTKILAPPPMPGSPEAKAELGRVLALQVARTPEQEAQAIADGLQDVTRFQDALGRTLPAETLANVAPFFHRLEETEAAVTDPSKAVWARMRPYRSSDLVRPVGRLSQSGSYPSGHATFGTLMGIMLAEMVPERRPEIMRRARRYAWNRFVAGIHFPSDIKAGRLAGTAIAAVLFGRDDFRQAFGAARAEIRAALDLPVAP